MLKTWLNAALWCATQPADFYCGARKILRQEILSFDVKHDLQLHHSGFTKSKLLMLRRNYVHAESRDIAQQLWERRLDQDKYGSVGFTTYNHFVKSDPAKQSRIASVMGPCIQSVTLTLTNDGKTEIDAFYRTTEMFKKFPADLVFIRDELLEGFDIGKDASLTCHFANITAHPMYFITLVPSLDDPILSLEKIRKTDLRFYKLCVQWSAQYVCDEYSAPIQKFSQALRVQKDALNRIDGGTLRDLRRYLRKSYPRH